MRTTLSVTFTDKDARLSVMEFRRKYKDELGSKLMSLKETWAQQLANTFQEIVKNFYYHAEKRGSIMVVINGPTVEWSATDCGPGDPEERNINEIIASTDRSSEKYINQTPNGPCGLGLMMIKGGFDSLSVCTGVAGSSWHLETKDRFTYHGLIILDGTGR